MKLKRRTIDTGNCTVIELAYARTGSILKAGRILAFIVQYGTASDDLGHDPSMDEYAEHWGIDRASAYRHLGEFRAVFGHPTPAPILEAMAAQHRGIQERADLSGLIAA